MNRKLKRFALALSTSSAVFVLLLVAGTPLRTQATLPELAVADATTIAADGVAPVLVPRQHHSRRSRVALALPYFSFAQGLRHVTAGS